MQKIKQFIIIVLTLIIATPTVVFAIDNPPSISLAVYGDVKIDNNVAPIGTIISVFNNNIEVARTIISQTGKYFIEVPAKNKEQLLTYKINDLQSAQVICANPLITPSVHLDLVIPIIVSSQNSGSNSSFSNNSIQESLAPVTTTLLTLVEPIITSIVPQVLGIKISVTETIVDKILGEAKLVSSRNLGSIVRDLAFEKNVEKKYFKTLILGLKTSALTSEQKSALINFITYGTGTTKSLGVGERAGVINSYKTAFNKLPSTETEWADAIKIANGKWPNERNLTVEKKAKITFKKIYKRDVKIDNQYDNASIIIISYGMRTASRNLASEKNATLSFKKIFKYVPTVASDWDIVRAIAYSGAKR
ncbi:MAG: hypothetical protein V1651_03905 [Patescibacteria group bacterium]